MRPTAGNQQVAAESAAVEAVSVKETEAEPLIEVRDLTVEFRTQSLVKAVHGISYAMAAGEHVGLVGESGSGKSASALALVRLLPRTATVSGSVELSGRELMTLSEPELREVRGDQVGIVYQDPFSSLNPVLTVGRQITEVLTRHKGMRGDEARAEAARLLEEVGVPKAVDRLADYPHQFSGGMRQRTIIAMAISPEPSVLIADEPTTALDVTVQAQILELLQSLTEQHHMAMLLITHDLGVIAGITQRVMVMYAGRLVESVTTEDLFTRASHPYTVALHQSLPRIDKRQERLPTIQGHPPDLRLAIRGCPFAPRCPRMIERCKNEDPPLMSVEIARQAASPEWTLKRIKEEGGEQAPGPDSPHLTACWNPPPPSSSVADGWEST